MKHFIDIKDISSIDLRKIIDRAKKRKLNRSKLGKSAADPNALLDQKVLAMFFEQPSLRTRVSFDIAAKQLGGQTLILNKDDIHYGKGEESIHDTAKLISEYADVLMLRTISHQNTIELAKHLKIPLINGLTNRSHPCQILSDILTFEEIKGPILNSKIAWIGDSNNVLNSLIEASIKFKFILNISCPKKYQPNKNILQWIQKNNGKVSLFSSPKDAVKEVDCVMTDKWISINDKINKKKKKKDFKKFIVNLKLMSYANKNAIFMHCLPANRGEEVSKEVIDGEKSVVWQQASNRVHAQKAIIEWCING
tara:strand:- start:59 stop:985 length:927 start_codon:yes stop_codon:yes gene_type:complete